VTEGPQDAQEWTIKNLGLAPLIDQLITSNQLGKSKVDGLFPAMLQELSIDAKDVIFIGDNATRDVEPAVSCGIDAVHFDPLSTCRLERQGARINTLAKLRHLLGLSVLAP
jgi:putative hydrolase of the HAD superfamily